MRIKVRTLEILMYELFKAQIKLINEISCWFFIVIVSYYKVFKEYYIHKN